MPSSTEEIKAEVQEILALERQVNETESALMQLDAFQAFIKLQKTFKEKSAEVWKTIEKQMLDNDIKSVKGDWGSLTIAERTDFDIDPALLPSKFFVKSPDVAKIRGTYKLEGVPPKGTTPKVKKYLTKRFK